MNETQDIKKRISTLKADLKIRVDTLSKQLESSRFEGERADLISQIDRLNGAYSRMFSRLEGELRAAEKEEAAKLADHETKRAAREGELKANALAEWERAGGNSKQFESAWASIRDAIYNERVIASLVSREQSGKAGKKPFTLS